MTTSRTSITPIFDTHQFLLRSDPSPRQFANLSNRIDVTLNRVAFYRYVEINSFLFTLMRALKVSRDSEAEMFLEVDGPKMLFGLVVDDREVYDLWHYTRDQIPHQVLRP